MSTSTRTVLKDAFLLTSGYSTGSLSVADCYELACDINFVEFNATSIGITVSRMDAFGKMFQLYTHSVSSTDPHTFTLDIGPTFNYDISRVFGDLIQIDFTGSGTTPTFSGTLSIKGKTA